MTDAKFAEEIERLAGLSGKATHGPWSAEEDYLIGYPPGARPNGEGITQYSCAVNPNMERSKADCEFTASLVNWFRSNITTLRREFDPVKPVFQAWASGTIQWKEEKCEQCGKTIILNARPPSSEVEKDTARLEWLHSELKLTIANALRWPVTPQDMTSFRAKIDAALKDHA